MFLHLDCRHYRGDRPCRFERLCEGCMDYEPMGVRVLLIKLGALGDVVRTGCLLPGLAAQTEAPHVTWLTSRAALPLVERMPGVHRSLAFGVEALAQLAGERFDSVICLDKEPAPCAVAMQVQAGRRQGIGLSRYGTPMPLTEECEYYFRLGLDNEEKFQRNRLTYPQLIYDALGVPYGGERYTLTPTADDRARAEATLAATGAPNDALWVGIAPGAGTVFANKAWKEERVVELIRQLSARKPEIQILLLGGSDETDLMDRIARACPDAPVHQPGGAQPLGVFAGLIERCAVVLTGDSLAMHLAVALKRRVVALFGPTSAVEIDLFGLGDKIVSPIDCAPCYRRHCDLSPNCQDKISVEKVLESLESQIEKLIEEG